MVLTFPGTAGALAGRGGERRGAHGLWVPPTRHGRPLRRTASRLEPLLALSTAARRHDRLLAPVLLLASALCLGSLAHAQDFSGADEVWADLEKGEQSGIQPMHAGGPHDYVERDMDGVPCVATNGATGKHWLCFDVARSFITSNRPARYTLIIRYLDEPRDGLVTVRYHAAHDPIAQAIRFQRQGSGEWREMVLQLKDAVLMNAALGVADIAVHGFTDTGDPRAADVYVGGIWLSKRLIDLSAAPAAIASGVPDDQRFSRVRAVVYAGAGGLAPDGTVIKFRATGGTIDPEAATQEGVAEATFRSDGTLGTAIVSADWDIVTAWTKVAVVAGDRPLREGDWVCETFEDAMAAEPERVGADTSFVDVVEEDPHVGQRCLRIHYCFSPAFAGQPYLTCPLSLTIPGRPAELRLWAKGDGSDHHLQFLLQDAQGTIYTVMPLGRVVPVGWNQLKVPVEEFDDCWGANADGVMDFPVTIIGARLVCLGGQRMEGDISLDQLTAHGLFPPAAAETVPESNEEAEAPRTQDGLLLPARREPLEWMADNLRSIPDAGALYGEARNLAGSPLGRDPEAIVAYRRLVELRPEDGNHRYTLARLLYKAGDFAGALEQIDAALAAEAILYFGEDWGRLLRAWCLDQLGRREEAVEEYKTVAAMPAQLNVGGAELYHRRGPMALMDAWCERGIEGPLAFHKRALNAGPQYEEITEVAAWTAQCNRGHERLPLAIDRNAETFWSPNFVQQAGDFFRIDMGEVVHDVARLVLDDDGGASIFPWDSPAPMKIEGSVDGERWEELGNAQGDAFNVIDVTWAPRSLRYLRATITDETAEENYVNWRIYEAYVYRIPPDG